MFNAQTFPKHFSNKTAYARSVGYAGRKPVMVSDGKVVSHRGLDWFEFLFRIRHRQPSPIES